MTIPDRGGGRVAMVMETIRQRVAGRALTAGARLPSIRQMARMAGVSPSTVVEAYDRLVAEGLIGARPGSGFYVAAQAAPLELARVGPRRDRAIDPLWVSRQSLEA
ncbi:MAG: winged helix-turn-helix domain-containing protein, partial [Nitratireductor sp.]